MATRRLYPGQPAHVRVAGGALSTGASADEVEPTMNGEIVAPRPTELALHLWQRVPGLEPGRPAALCIEVEHHCALYFADSGPVEPPYPGETFWAPAPFEWTRVDRWRAYRLTVDVPVHILLAGQSVPAVRHLLDLSAAGWRIEHLAVDVGTVVELRFGLASSAVEMAIRARVVRAGGKAPDAWTGLAFVDLDNAGEERISRFLLDEQRRHLGTRLRDL